ncbi:metallophosphoesterase [bacterium]|nr:metallophosphoesterase [bacterium]
MAGIFGCQNSSAPYYNDGDWSFVAFGDLRQGFGIYKKLAISMGSEKPAPLLAVCLGDIMLEPGNEAEWLKFWKYSDPITEKMPLLIVRGNHEGNDAASEWLYRVQTGIPEGQPFYFSKQVKDQLMIILDTEIPGEENSISNMQLDWLKAQLDSASISDDISGIFIFMHRPLYRQGIHKGETLDNAREMHELFKQNKKIRAVVAGHDHMYHYMKKDGINYIISGGAGAPLIHGYGGDYYHYLLFTFNDKINMKAIGVFNEINENRNL